MTPKELLNNAINPALALLEKVASIKPSDEARVIMLAIAGQESAWTHRVQIGGPAHSFWQFELGGGVVGVVRHPSTRDKIKAVCDELGVLCAAGSIYQEMTNNDVLAACMARLLLWTDAAALPAVGEEQSAWDYYLRNWRPGLPHPEAWPARYAKAVEVVKNSAAE